MRAISLWEPYASLIRTGAKTWETRSWATHYRGPLLICAAKGGLKKPELISKLSQWHFQGGLAPLIGKSLELSGYTNWPGVKISDLNFGMAVAVVELIHCIPTFAVSGLNPGGPLYETFFGDFHNGRYAWKLKLIEAIKPFPVKGRQGFFEVKI